MKLIDADKLELKETVRIQLCGLKEYVALYSYTKEQIEEAPTVKAIPIDKPFLKARYGDYVVYNKKWLVNHLQTEWNILQGKEYQPSIPTEWIKKYASMKRTNDEMDCYWHFWEEDVLKMVADWEKENET